MIVINSTAVNVSWVPPNGSYCIDNYIVAVDNGTTKNFSTNFTNIIINELEQGIIYNFSVRAIDLMGRKGTISETVSLMMNGMKIEIIL